MCDSTASIVTLQGKFQKEFSAPLQEEYVAGLYLEKKTVKLHSEREPEMTFTLNKYALSWLKLFF